MTNGLIGARRDFKVEIKLLNPLRLKFADVGVSSPKENRRMEARGSAEPRALLPVAWERFSQKGRKRQEIDLSFEQRQGE